jgi:4-hydroxy-tetrahydrodipicolinate reductase
MIRIVLNGYSGKMGKMITECANNFKGIEIIAGIDKFPSDTSYPIFENVQDLNIDYDVLLDFSRADALQSLLELTEKKQ